MKVLVINAGSSSLKYQLLDTDSQDVLAKGLCERIGIDGKFTYKAPGKETIDARDVAMPTHAEAIQAVLDALVDPANGVVGSMKEIEAVGHRVVHGGETFASSVKIDGKVMAALEDDDVQVYRTDCQGTVIAISNGKELKWRGLQFDGSQKY